MGVNNIKALWLRMTRLGKFTVVFPAFVPILMLQSFKGLLWSTITMGALLIYIGWGRQDSICICHDEELFKQLPLNEECPICMMLLPSHHCALGGATNHAVGKNICGGCIKEIRIKSAHFAGFQHLNRKRRR